MEDGERSQCGGDGIYWIMGPDGLPHWKPFEVWVKRKRESRMGGESRMVPHHLLVRILQICMIYHNNLFYWRRDILCSESLSSKTRSFCRLRHRIFHCWTRTHPLFTHSIYDAVEWLHFFSLFWFCITTDCSVESGTVFHYYLFGSIVAIVAVELSCESPIRLNGSRVYSLWPLPDTVHDLTF